MSAGSRSGKPITIPKLYLAELRHWEDGRTLRVLSKTFSWAPCPFSLLIYGHVNRHLNIQTLFQKDFAAGTGCAPLRPASASNIPSFLRGYFSQFSRSVGTGTVAPSSYVLAQSGINPQVLKPVHNRGKRAMITPVGCYLSA